MPTQFLLAEMTGEQMLAGLTVFGAIVAAMYLYSKAAEQQSEANYQKKIADARGEKLKRIAKRERREQARLRRKMLDENASKESDSTV